MGKVIAFSNQKGGSGKSTLSANIAVLWSNSGYKVAVIDADPQKSLSYWLSERIKYYGEDKNTRHQEYGYYTDPQAPGAFSRYGDLIFDSLLTYKQDKVEAATGLQLCPNYSYHRLYVTGHDLKPHKDRASCDLSATVCIGYDNRNLDYDYNWPIYMEDTEVNMQPGDMVIYKGCELTHYRKEFLGLNHAQVFLHWHDKNKEEFKDKKPFDGRPILGLGPLFDEMKK